MKHILLKVFSYVAYCIVCGIPIYMSDVYDELDEHVCEECRP